VILSAFALYRLPGCAFQRAQAHNTRSKWVGMSKEQVLALCISV
jgi:hypothetical protein